MSSRYGFNWDREHRERIPRKAQAREGGDTWQPPRAWKNRAERLRYSSNGVQLRRPNK